MNKSISIVAFAALAFLLPHAMATNETPGKCGAGQKTKGCAGSGGAGGRADARALANSAASASSSAQGGSANANGGNATAAGGQGGSSSATGGQVVGTGTVSVVGDSNTYQGARRAAASAYAPALTPVYTCSGGTSFGVQGMGGGVSFGNATASEVCETVYMATAASNQGDPQTAREVLCTLPQVRAARKRTGSPCWADRPENQAKAGEPTDPFVRARLGLPKLD